MIDLINKTKPNHKYTGESTHMYFCVASFSLRKLRLHFHYTGACVWYLPVYSRANRRMNFSQ